MATLAGVLSSALFLLSSLHIFSADAETFEYNVACPPSHRPSYPTYSGCKLLMYSGANTADVTINSASQLWSKHLAIGERYEFEVSSSDIVSSGKEEKRLRILASNEISVVIQKQDLQSSSDQYVGATEVYESRFYGHEFYPVSLPRGCTSSSYTNAYYTVVPSGEKTRIVVYQDDVYIESIMLTQYEVYTNSTTSDSVDFSTFVIYADAPVAVFSGSPCVENAVDGSYISTVPPVKLYGTLFFGPPILSGSVSSDYTVRILASEDSTAVTMGPINEVINRGSLLDVVIADGPVTVTCSKPCLATQYAHSVSSSAGFGSFQFNLVAQERFYLYAGFSTLHYTSSNEIAITVHGEAPYNGLKLDGSSLDNASWQTEGVYGYLTMSVSQGSHTLESQRLPFAVYVYGHTGYYGGGYGYEARLQGDFVPEPTPEPTPPPTPEMLFEYTALCVPTYHNTNTDYADCKLMIVTDDELAVVKMTSLYTTWDFEVRQGTPVVMMMDRAFQLTSGVEEKRLKIVSDKELLVTTTKEDSYYGDRYVETTTWPEKKTAGTEFYLLQGDSARNGCTSSSYRNAFYAFASFGPTTFVEVYDNDELESIDLLGEYGTYSRYSTSAATDYTGLRVFATKPIAVISGTLCVTDVSMGTYFDMVPPSIDFGQEFVVPSIAGPEVSAKYAVRVLAAEESTVVEQDGVSYPLNTGESVMFDYDTILGTNVITCTTKCLAVFFQRATLNNIGHFMMRLLPSDQFYSANFFSTNDMNIVHYVTIIVNGLPPMDDIFLDGASLEDLVWGSRRGYSVARVEILKGQHYIESTRERKFTLYVYGHTLSYGGGYGFGI